MLTALYIDERRGGMLSIFRRNRIRAEQLYCDEAALKSITYEHYRGRIGWQSIDRFVRAQRNHLLCPEGMKLPVDGGYKRFSSSELSRRMCGNAALYLLRELGDRRLRTVLIDRNGDAARLCERLTEYCDPVHVVTDAAELYIEQAEYLLREKGAALRVSRSGDSIRSADLVISPSRIEADLHTQPTALILSGEPPLIYQNAPVICEYFIDLPSKFREMKPAYLDDMYFASALYTLGGVHQLGSELFTRCGDSNILHTRRSLFQTLRSRQEGVSAAQKAAD